MKTARIVQKFIVNLTTSYKNYNLKTSKTPLSLEGYSFKTWNQQKASKLLKLVFV